MSKPNSRMVQVSMESSDLGSMSYPASSVSFIMILYRSEARRRLPPVVSFSARRDMLTASRDGSRHLDLRGGASDTGARREPVPPLTADEAPAAPLLLLTSEAEAAAWSPSALAVAETAWGMLAPPPAPAAIAATAAEGWSASTRKPP